ncbi:hypothetical protein LEP1GSC172_0738 [Leptospira noguchii]|uniref:Uncharacterized protein n=1 Tax=Leptospira noguchii TaxID=28182 RepID=M6VAK7_9LEPT|nr:hypothetical protein LEP1GSC172_0738 [Leptospira noguchii]
MDLFFVGAFDCKELKISKNFLRNSIESISNLLEIPKTTP